MKIVRGLGAWAAHQRLISTVFGAILLVALLSITTTLHAQVYYGTIVGNVTDASGAAIPGAAVTVINKGTNNKFNAKTSNLGAYTVTQLPVGTYEVDIEQGNFKKYVAKDVQVHTSTDTELNATLTVGEASETITVEANQVQVQTTSASVGEVIDGTQVRELPLNGENFVGLTQLSPGVSAAADFNGTGKGLSGGVDFSVNGNPYTNNLFLIDGVNNNDVGSNRTILIYPSVDAIAEFKMIRNSYGPEYGQASGAIISLTTKSGTNTIHGGFFYSGRNDALDTNDWISNDNGTGKAKLRRNDYGYHIAGPLMKDKLFLWFNQEWNREVRGGSYGTCVPTDAESAGDFSGYGAATTDQCGATIPSIPAAFQAAGNPLKIANPDAAGLLIAQFYPSANYNAANQKAVNVNGYNWVSSIPNLNLWSEYNVRGDYDVTKNNRVTLRYTADSWSDPAPNNPTLDGLWGESSFPTVQSSGKQPSTSAMGKLSSTIHQTMVNDVEFGYGHNAIITSVAGTRADIVSGLETAFPSSFPSSIKTPGEFFGGWGGLNPYGSYEGDSSIWNLAPYANHEDLYTIQDNLSKVKGNHVYKAGVFYSTNEKVEDTGNGADRPGLQTNPYCDTDAAGHQIIGVPGHPACAQTNNALANVLIPGTGTMPQEYSISEASQDATAYVHWNDYEFYLQDSWKIRRNVTLEYGFRWSFYREPVGENNAFSNWNQSAWSASEAAAHPDDACNGIIIVPGTTPCQNAVTFLSGLGISLPLSNGTPGPNRSLLNQANHDIAPRVGIAWDIFGDGKTALRLGGGQFYQREAVAINEGMAHNAPFVITASSNRSFDTPTALNNPSVSPNYAKDPRPFTPNSWQWNATVEQELAPNTTMELGYVGNVGLHLTSMYDFNAVPQSGWLATAFASGAVTNGLNNANAYRPAYNFGQIGGFARGGHASYHSLQALFRSQQKRSTFQAAYTWSHSIGNVDEDNSSGSFGAEGTTAIQYPGLDKGNTNINRPNIFVANEVLFLPKLDKSNELIRESVGGWELTSIFTAMQGSSLTVFSSGATGACTKTDPVTQACVPGYNSTLNSLIGTGYNGNNRPLTTGIGCNEGEHGNQILNPNAFTLVGYVIGTIPANVEHRGYCSGARTVNWDAQLAKNWQLHEKYRIKFSMDFFDFLNHPNFNTSSLEGTGFTSPTPVYCGGATATSGLPCSPTNNVITSQGTVTGFGSVQALQVGRSNRELQYTLRFDF